LQRCASRVTLADGTPMSPRALSALVVDPDAPTRVRTVTALADAGFHVISTDAFEAARYQIVAAPPSILVTTLKLEEYNGLHLVLRARAAEPRTACLLTVDESANFQKEAEQAGATYIVGPVSTSELMAAVLRTLFQSDPSVHVSAPFERRRTDRRTATLDSAPNRRRQQRRRELATLIQAARS
jgi:DNA-binding response OmpR family regulator